jgi:hypothetical protein
MGYNNVQIDKKFVKTFNLKPKSGFRKWLKHEHNRKIRRIKQTEIPHIKYSGWEY